LPNRDADAAVCCDADDVVLPATVGEPRLDGAVGWLEQASAALRVKQQRRIPEVARIRM
jgi:hypothetical protein